MIVVSLAIKKSTMLLRSGCNCTYATPAPDTLNGTCVQSYVNHWTTEHASTGAANNHVCLFTDAKDFEWMVRVSSRPVALPGCIAGARLSSSHGRACLRFA